jgi:Ca2+-binding RTX toxin-like protein
MGSQRARLATGAALLAAAGLFAPAAHAATIKVSQGSVVAVAAPGEANDVAAEVVGGTHSDWTLRVVDAGAPLIAGPGCDQLDANSVSCAHSQALIVWAGDGNDRVRLSDRFGFDYAEIHGEEGDDTASVSSVVGLSPLLDGGPGDDLLSVNMNSGGDIPILQGGPGNDFLGLFQVDGGKAFGGPGDDRIVTGSDGTTPLMLDGGMGNDTYTFFSVTRPLALVPGPGSDTLDESTATPRTTSLPFEIDMSACSGCVERVIGTPLDDHITGDARAEVILGGSGDDVLDGGRGSDVLAGQDGDDTITSRDGMFDIVGCDGGADTVFADRFDLVSRDCETVRRRAPNGT